MDDLYIKEGDGRFVPITLEVASSRDLVDKLIIVTVGNDQEPAGIETLEYVQRRFIQSKVIIDAMKHSKDANLLILPHIIKIELFSKKELDSKTVCVKIEARDDINNIPELKEQIKGVIKKDITILPTPISLKEYKEIKAVRERISTRKQRHGGGLRRE